MEAEQSKTKSDPQSAEIALISRGLRADFFEIRKDGTNPLTKPIGPSKIETLIAHNDLQERLGTPEKL